MGTILHEGYLLKNKKLRTRNWTKRWFVLREKPVAGHYVLEYYKCDKKKKLSAVIDLDPCEEVERLNPVAAKDKYRYMFRVKTTDAEYFLVASSEAEMMYWMDRILRLTRLRKNSDEDTDRSQNHRILDSLRSPGSAGSPRIGALPSSASSHSSIAPPRAVQERSSPSASSVHSSNESLSSGARSSVAKKQDSPYILLSNCVCRSNENGKASDRRAQLERQPSIPEEPAPLPPPGSATLNSPLGSKENRSPNVDDNFYKLPPTCEVYKGGSGQRRAIQMSPRDSGFSETATYDRPKLSLMEESAHATYDRPKLSLMEESPVRPNVTPANGDVYDKVPATVRALDSFSPPASAFARKQSLPTEAVSQDFRGEYDVVPKAKQIVSGFTTLPNRKHSGFDRAVEKGSFYDHVPRRGSDDTRIGQGQSALYDRPPPSGLSVTLLRTLPVVHENGGPQTPPAVNRQNKPFEGDSPHSDPKSARLVHSSGERRSDMKSADVEKVSQFVFPDGKVRRSSSQENLPAEGTTRNGAGLAARGHGSMGIPAKPLTKASVEYTDLEFSNTTQSKPRPPVNMGPLSQTLPRQFHVKASPRATKTAGGIEYKHIDPMKTDALLRIKSKSEATWKS